MLNARASAQNPGDQDRDLSVDELWSGAESETNSRPTWNGSNGLKRKRPLTVSYVAVR